MSKVKRERIGVTLTKKAIEWLRKNRPDHMSRSVALEHYFWVGIESEATNQPNKG